MSIFLKIQDTVDGKLGSVYLTIDGRRYEVPGIQKIEAHDVVKERTLKTVGTVRTQTAVAGVEGSGTMTIQYYAISIFGKIIEKYRREGNFTPFDLLIVNYDKGTGLGRRSASFSNCTLCGDVPLAALDSTIDDALTIDLKFKYDDFYILEDFAEPTAIGRE
ncbi:MAG TPA: phage tail tube protein [Firmicutes bacterium]|nr:phage tail tube protein [Bacillota bacterium]